MRSVMPLCSQFYLPTAKVPLGLFYAPSYFNTKKLKLFDMILENEPTSQPREVLESKNPRKMHSTKKQNKTKQNKNSRPFLDFWSAGAGCSFSVCFGSMYN